MADAGLDLGNHSAGDGAIGDQLARPTDGQLRDQHAVPVEHTRHVGQQQKAGCLGRGGENSSHRIGIDVVGRPIRTSADGGDHGDHSRLFQPCQHADIDLGRLADIAQVEARSCHCRASDSTFGP